MLKRRKGAVNYGNIPKKAKRFHLAIEGNILEKNYFENLVKVNYNSNYAIKFIKNQ
jgi:hypothetical protein